MRYRIREPNSRRPYAEATLCPCDAISIGGTGETSADALETAAGTVEMLGKTPLVAIPQVAAAVAAATVLRKSIAAARSGEAERVLSTLSTKARRAVTSVLDRIF